MCTSFWDQSMANMQSVKLLVSLASLVLFDRCLLSLIDIVSLLTASILCVIEVGL